MLTRPSGYMQALAAPHRVYARVDVHSGAGALLQSNLPFFDGAVEATLTSRVARRLSLTVDATYYPADTSALLGPFGNEIRAYRGIEYGDGLVVAFPVFRGRINQVNLGDDGTVAVSCLDRAGDIADANFEAPHVAIPGFLVDEVRRLILEALPDAGFSFPEAFGERISQLVWESDRSGALDELGTAAGAFWYPLADGRFTFRRVAWAQSSAAEFTLSDGTGGTVLRSQASRSREGVFNSVTVLAERADGSDPVFYTARDTLPSSPTYAYGNFGLRARQFSVQSALTESQAQTAAETLLRRSKSLTETWALEIVPDASIELGDTFTLTAKGRTVTQVVAGFGMPLSTPGTMSVSCRAVTPEVTG